MGEDYNGNWCFSLAERWMETFAQIFFFGGGELLRVGGKRRDC